MTEKYIGTELSLFARATNWKKYYVSIISPYVSGNVLEIGAGAGMTTKLFCPEKYERWVCLEPDPLLLENIKHLIDRGELPRSCIPQLGNIEDVKDRLFDTIIYIDVLEHIEDDKEEIKRSLHCLQQGGNLAILSPAHQWLYSTFDSNIGHYRRYSKNTLSSVITSDFKCIKLIYIDSVGILLSLANKFILYGDNPSLTQILIWDKLVIPLSKVIDRLLFFSLGKSVIGIWKKI
jgi:hypothetical protein